ncbi:MFS transporter [Rhodovulum sp. PH10]|uniref:MFS transporter n=1 Tax=Rhodovulum sp. PH10 TaxID=1187851 RepID=UPI00059058EF|nr:MFS transporter [Rhodovulum sp. PH10]
MSEPISSTAASDPPENRRLLAICALALFATSLFMRAIDPVVPQIAGEFSLDVRTVALLSTAYTLPYALIQPVLGSFADTLGKSLVLKVSLVTTAVAGLMGALAPDFSVLFASRIMTGVVSGGIFPISLAIAGDLVPVSRRQIAFGHMLAASMLGNLLGSPLAGVIADLVGWRGIFAVIGCFAFVVYVAVEIGFRGVFVERRGRFDLPTILAGYGAVMKNPLAKICFFTVFVEGAVVFGFFPYVAALLAMRGEASATIAGIVIAAFAVGGIVYSSSVSRLLNLVGERPMMAGGSLFMATGLMVTAIGFSWPVDVVAFMVLGFGFYSMHGVVQIYATELAPASRGLAMALHSFCFFMGQAVGPVAYRYGIAGLGTVGAVALAGAGLVAVGVLCAATLRRTARA